MEEKFEELEDIVKNQEIQVNNKFKELEEIAKSQETQLNQIFTTITTMHSLMQNTNNETGERQD